LSAAAIGTRIAASSQCARGAAARFGLAVAFARATRVLAVFFARIAMVPRGLCHALTHDATRSHAPANRATESAP
jgi:hypothetical protein